MQINQDIAKRAELLSQAVGKDITDALSSQFEELSKINQILPSVAEKLETLYADKFPKICNNCGKIFQTREQYLAATSTLKKKNSAQYTKSLDLVQEYRNCSCGSSLMIYTTDRRDLTAYGLARRELFDTCLERLQHLSSFERGILAEALRKVFRSVIEQNEIRDPSLPNETKSDQ